MVIFSNKPISVPERYLKRFIQASRNGYHGMGWGVVWFDDNGRIHAKRSTKKIWKSDWKGIGQIQSRCIMIHARQANPFGVCMENTHPIVIDGKNFMIHNGIIALDSFPELLDPILNKISKKSNLDTRRYLVTYLDALKRIGDSYKAFKEILPKMKISISANTFILNRNELQVVKCRTDSVIGGSCELYIEKKEDLFYCVSAVPFNSNYKKIPNKTYINYDFREKKINLRSLIEKN
ncbi:MAG: hypothetical protein GY870_14885 [archaeon]|nr:hypothetical protein [archaeon]